MDAGTPPSSPEIGATLLELVVMPTLDDHVQYAIYLYDRPAIWRRRVAIAAASLLRGPLLGLVSGFVIGWVTGPRTESFATDVGVLSAADWRQGLETSLLVSEVLATLAGVVHLLRRRILRWRLRPHIAERPGIDPGDPFLRSHVRVTLAERGFVLVGEGNHSVVAADSVKAIGETGTALIIMVGRIAGFIFPKRDLSADQVRQFQAITERWLARPEGGRVG